MENYQSDKVLHAAVEWAQRPLEPIYPVIRFDELEYHVCVDSKIVKKYGYVVSAVTLSGRKDVLGLWVNHDRTMSTWNEAIGSLKKRGVMDIFLACADNINGLSDALLMHFPQTDFEATATHVLQNSMKYVFNSDQSPVKAGLKTIYMAENAVSAADALNIFADKWNGKYPAIAQFWRENWKDLDKYFTYPQEIRYLIQPVGQLSSLIRSLRKQALLHPLGGSDDDLFKKLYLEILDLTKDWRGVSNSWSATYLQLERFFGQRMPKR